MSKPRIVVTRRIPQPALDLLAEHGDVWLSPHDRPLTREELFDAVKGADAIVCLLHDAIDDEVLDAMELAFREFKLVVEPGGAVALAAALTGKLPVKGRAVAVVCSGGNVDHATFMRALARRAL